MIIAALLWFAFFCYLMVQTIEDTSKEIQKLKDFNRLKHK